MSVFSFNNIKRLTTGVAVAALVMAPVACGDDDDEPVIATQNLVAPVTAATFDALDGATVSFPAAAGAVLSPALAGQSVTMSFASTGTSRTASITPSGGGTINSNVSFGSCIFTITSSTVPGITAGQVITVPNCGITVGTAGVEAGGNAGVPLTVNLGGTTSAPVTVTVTIGTDGTVTVTSPSGKTVEGGTVGTGPLTGSVT